MRIALVTETFPPEINGVARTLRQLISGLCARGHAVQVVRPRQSKDEPDDGADWRQLLTRGCPIPFYEGLRFGFPTFSRLRKAWSLDSPHVVHIATEGPLGLGALLAARRLGVPAMSSFHTNFHQYGRHYGYGVRLAVGYLRWFHNHTRRTLVPSPDVRDILAGDGFERLELLGRGVDGELFHPRRRDGGLRREWGALDHTPVALYVGRLAEEKNPALLARAFAELRRARPGAKTVVVGDGPAADRYRRADPDTVFCGMRRGAELGAHYASADVMLSPSTTETFGNVVLEAMASGLPVLTFDYAAGRQLVRHDVNGWLAPFDDRERFLALTRSLATLPVEHLRAMGARARETAGAQTWHSVVQRFEALLDETASLEPRGSSR